MSETPFKYKPRVNSEGEQFVSTYVHDGIDAMDAEMCRGYLHHILDFMADNERTFLDIYLQKSYWENTPERVTYYRMLKNEKI